MGRFNTNNNIHYGLANIIGDPLINFIMEDIRNVSEGICAFKTGSKWGFMDRFGRQLSNRNSLMPKASLMDWHGLQKMMNLNTALLIKKENIL